MTHGLANEINPTGMRTTSWHYYAVLGALGLLLAVLFQDAYLGDILHPLQVFIASITTYLLGLLNIEVIQQGAVLVHRSGFACEITPGCTGLVAVIMYLVAVFMYPATEKQRAIGLLTGIPFLIGINFVRLVHLYYIGSFHIARFDLFHEVIWQSLIALSVVAAWWVWTAWSRKTSLISPSATILTS